MIARRGVLGSLAGGVAMAALGAGPAAAAKGWFVGDVQTVWDHDGRHMQLLAPFSYIDPNGVEWKVPKGATVDGASIPQPAWTLIGGPFEGKYRNPSVIHDWYCDVRTRPWESVHRMFLQGMLDAGVDELQARLMYYAVYAGGPRWDDQAIENNKLAVEQKVAALSRDPAPSVFQTCPAGGGTCNVIYRTPPAAPSPAAYAAVEGGGGRGFLGGLGHLVDQLLGSHPYTLNVQAAAPPPPLVVTYNQEGAVVTPPVTDPKALMALAGQLANSRTGLADAEAAIDQARTPGG